MSESVLDKMRCIPKGLIILGLFILFVVCLRVRLLDIPLERDEGEYAYMGQLLLEGIPPYSEAYNMKFPGTYLMYALIMAIFGQTAAGIHTGLMIVNSAAIVVVYLLARKMVDEIPAAVAGGTYAILSISSSLFGFAAHATHFVALPALGGTLLLLRSLEKEKPGLFFFSGALLGISVIMKQPGIFFVLFGGTYIILQHIYSRRSPVFHQLGAFSIGAVLPLLLTALWLYAAGVFEKFWFWTIVYASKYAAQVSLPEALLRLRSSFLQVVDGFYVIWIMAAFGIGALFFSKRFKHAGNHRIFIILFALFSFLSVLPGFYFRHHYYVTLLPAVSLLVSIFIDFVCSVKVPFLKLWFSKLLAVGLFLMAAAIGVIQQRDNLFADNPVMLSGSMYSGNPFPESLPIAKFIEERTSPDDRIAILGSEPQIFFYAKRRSATGYIYTYSLMEIHEYALAMQKEMIAEVEASNPKFLIDVRAGESWQQQEESENYIWGWLDRYLAGGYTLVGVVDVLPPAMSVYRWYADATDYKPQSPWSLLIYERR